MPPSWTTPKLKRNILYEDYLNFLVTIILSLLQGQLCAQVHMLDVKWHGEVVDTDSLTINSTDIDIKILPDGSVNGMFNGKEVEFSFQIEDDYHVPSVDWFVTDSLHIIFYEESIGTHSGTYFVLVGKESFNIKHKEKTGGFNFKEPIFKSHYIYLRTIGVVGKYDIEKRKYSWFHDGLYNRERGIFNIIEKPIFKDGKVLFVSRNKNKANIDTLIVDDKSGTILNKN